MFNITETPHRDPDFVWSSKNRWEVAQTIMNSADAFQGEGYEVTEEEAMEGLRDELRGLDIDWME